MRLKSFVFAAVVVFVVSQVASAGPFRRTQKVAPTATCTPYGCPPATYTATSTTTYNSTTNVVNGYATTNYSGSYTNSYSGSYTTSSAQGVANIQAANNAIGHHGGNPGYEGCGFSAVSADDAIRHCCYWGQLTPAEIGVARGPSGWFACVRYR